MKRLRHTTPFEWQDSDEADVWSRDEPPLEQADFNAANTVQLQAPDKRARRVQDDEPRVSARDNFLRAYNETMNKRFPVTVTCDGEESSHDQAAAPVLFESLFEAPVAPPQRVRRPRVPYDKETRPECFLCAWGNRYHDGMEAKHAANMDTIMDQYGGCDNLELAQQLVLYFAKYVYPSLSARYPGTPLLTLEVALEHIEHHILDAVIFQGESVRCLRELRFGLEQVAFRANGRPDKDTVTLLLQVQRMLNTQMTMKVENMLFNFGKSNEDTRKIGRRFTFMEIFKQRQERDDRRARIEEVVEGVDDEFDI